MLRCYHYQLRHDITNKEFSDAIKQSVHHKFEHIIENEHGGYLLAENDEIFHLEQALPSLIEDFDYSVSIMVSFGYNAFTRYLLQLSLHHHFKMLYYCHDVALRALLDRDSMCQYHMEKMFQSLTREDLDTLKTYFQCGFNAVMASKILFIHRNTFQYRIARIFDKTGIDFKDFNNALLLYYYEYTR